MVQAFVTLLLCSVLFCSATAQIQTGRLSLTYKDCGGAGSAKITGMTPGIAPIGKRTALKINAESIEDIADGTMSVQTKLWQTLQTPFASIAFSNCSLDASRGGVCDVDHSNLPGASDFSTCYNLDPAKEKTCKELFSRIFGNNSVAVGGLDFPLQAGPMDINMNMHVTKMYGESETKVMPMAPNGDKIFCIRLFAGKKDKNGARPLSFRDCGDSQTSAKILKVFPDFLKEGEGTELTVKAVLHRSIASPEYATFVQNSGSMNPALATFGNLADCSGAAGEKMACPLKLGLLPHTPYLPLGSIKSSGMNFPIFKGPTSFDLELFLNSLVPEVFALTSTRIRASTKSGAEFLCIEVQSEPACCSSNPDCGFCAISTSRSALASTILV